MPEHLQRLGPVDPICKILFPLFVEPGLAGGLRKICKLSSVCGLGVQFGRGDIDGVALIPLNGDRAFLKEGECLYFPDFIQFRFGILIMD